MKVNVTLIDLGVYYISPFLFNGNKGVKNWKGSENDMWKEREK